jgi:chromosome segregation ATPase
MASPSATQATRRRQRSIRVTAAVGLLVLAALVVAGAAVTGSWLLVTIAAGLGVLLGAAATRITHTELVESRVTAARERATQARAYGVLADQRSADHAAYVAEVRARLADREQALDELEEALGEAQRRAATSTRKRNAEGRRAGDLQVRLVEAEERGAISQLRINELEQDVLGLRAELDSVTAAWHAAEHPRKHA